MSWAEDRAAHGFEDWWSHIHPFLALARAEAADMITRPLAEGDIARMYYKARKGWMEHACSIVGMDVGDIHREAVAEVDDLTVYLAAKLALVARRRREAA